MAILKSLIVNGVAKHLNDSYLNVIKSGTWNGSVIGVAYGGTGVSSSVGSTNNPVYLDSNGISVCSALQLVVDTTKNLTLTANTWATSGVTASTTGTYAIQITYSNDVYSGVFCINTNINANLTEEIPLVKNGQSSSARFYAGVLKNTIYLASNTAGTYNNIGIKIRRLI